MKPTSSLHRKDSAPSRRLGFTDIAANVMTCHGALGDEEYPALEIRLAEFKSPYVLRLALPAVVYKALAEQIDPVLLYEALARAVNSVGAANSLGDASGSRNPN